MTFDQQPTITQIPTEILTIEILLIDTSEENDPHEPKSAHFDITVADQNGRPMGHYHGNLVPYLTNGQVQGLLDFMTDVRQQAEAQILP